MIPIPIATEIINPKGTTNIEITASSVVPVEFWLNQHLKLIDRARSCGGNLMSKEPEFQLPPNAVWCVIHFNSMVEMKQFFDGLQR